MKKLILLLLAVMLLTACGQTTKNNQEAVYVNITAEEAKEIMDSEEGSDTMLPEGLETVHPRYAISRRNGWMLKQADFVVTYITHTWGGAAQYAEKAKRAGKTVINLAPESAP